jgi:acetolactate synthase regulatory subunit
MSLTVDLRPGGAALAGVVLILHSRAANVASVTYAADRGVASLEIGVIASRERAERLAAQIDRRVDVLAVRLTGEDDHDD